jgi:hypothetical protein
MLSWQVGRSGVDHPHRRDGFPEHQRKGMGSALLTQVIAEYRRRAGWSASIWAPAKRAGASTQASASNWSPTSPSGLWIGPSQRRTRGLSEAISDVLYGSEAVIRPSPQTGRWRSLPSTFASRTFSGH